MIDASRWDSILEIIGTHNRFVITTHINPDGDAIGSEIALSLFLKNQGKTVHIVNISPTIYNYQFLDPNEEIIVFDAEKHCQLLSDADVFFFVDISEWSRLEKLGEQIRVSSAPKICIDHHHLEAPFADIDIIHQGASSTGELIHEFLKHANYEIKGETARALYVCILTDTGSFRFSNTTALTHAIASELVSSGIDARWIYQEIYERNSRGKIILMGKALSGLRFECDGKLAWFVITQEMFREAEADKWDTESLPEIPRTIDGVEVSLMFTELAPDKIKISLRSKGKIVINHIAMKLGGGGHAFAAGAVVDRSLQESITWTLEQVKAVVGE